MKDKIHMCCDCGCWTEHEIKKCLCGGECFETISKKELLGGKLK